MQTDFRAKSVDIFLYDSTTNGNRLFWLPDSEFFSSKQTPENKIIITTHSVRKPEPYLFCLYSLTYSCVIQALKSEFTAFFASRTDKSRPPWELSTPVTDSLKGSIFGQKFLTVTVDEMHLMRNLGPMYYATLAIYNQATIRIGLTGTPLHTAPKVSFLHVCFGGLYIVFTFALMPGSGFSWQASRLPLLSQSRIHRH